MSQLQALTFSSLAKKATALLDIIDMEFVAGKSVFLARCLGKLIISAFAHEPELLSVAQIDTVGSEIPGHRDPRLYYRRTV